MFLEPLLWRWLSAPAALEDLCPFVLRDHSLYLHEQFIFGGLARRSMNKHRCHTAFTQLVEQQHLVRIFSSESIWTMYVEQINAAIGGTVAQTLERRR